MPMAATVLASDTHILTAAGSGRQYRIDVALLPSRRYAGFDLVKRFFLDLNHCAVAAPGLHAGLLYSLAKR